MVSQDFRVIYLALLDYRFAPGGLEKKKKKKEKKKKKMLGRQADRKR